MLFLNTEKINPNTNEVYSWVWQWNKNDKITTFSLNYAVSSKTQGWIFRSSSALQSLQECDDFGRTGREQKAESWKRPSAPCSSCFHFSPSLPACIPLPYRMALHPGFSLPSWGQVQKSSANLGRAAQSRQPSPALWFKFLAWRPVERVGNIQMQSLNIWDCWRKWFSRTSGACSQPSSCDCGVAAERASSQIRGNWVPKWWWHKQPV